MKGRTCMRKNNPSRLRNKLKSVRSSNKKLLCEITHVARIARNHRIIDPNPPPPPPKKKKKTKEEIDHGQ